MAKLNGREVEFRGLAYAQIGEKISQASPSNDGKGIILVLTEAEENLFEADFGMGFANAITTLVADAIEQKTSQRPSLRCRYNIVARTLTIY